ncbi:hypothetical protein EYF80_024666 [Liparis tanakae]|uniref:Uncharacterized protein n=1 Tax=Liparis tanakae TaxID=230148 RepID=A0A4Z2HH29_9TELE|nr:hypothetical protein EYF80_024666 [Liparis tanakae]
METTRPSTQLNKDFLPPRKQEREEIGRSYTASLASIEDSPFSPQPHHTARPPKWAVDEDIFLRARCENDSDDDDYTDADPVLDDLYFRRVQHTLHQTSNNPNSDRFLPRYWTPEEDSRVRTIYLGSQRRPWYRKMQGLSHKALDSSWKCLT